MSIKSITEPNDNKALNLYCNSITATGNLHSRKEFEPLDLSSLNNNWRFFVPLNVFNPYEPPTPLPKFNWLLEQDDDTATITGKCRATNTGLNISGFSFDIPTTINFDKIGNINFFGKARSRLIEDTGGTSRVWNLYNVDVSLVNNIYQFELFFSTLKGLEDNDYNIDIHFMITYQK